MTFTPSEHPRDNDGKFAEKLGAAPEISLFSQTPTSVAEAVEEFRSTLNEVGFGAKRDFNLRKDVMADYDAGRTPPHDHHYEAMWNGTAVNVLGGQDGWSEDVVRSKVANIERLQADLAEERVQPGEFGYGPTFRRSDISKWLVATKVELEDGLRTRGRSLVRNAKDARQRYADFEGGGNFR